MIVVVCLNPALDITHHVATVTDLSALDAVTVDAGTVEEDR